MDNKDIKSKLQFLNRVAQKVYSGGSSPSRKSDLGSNEKIAVE